MDGDRLTATFVIIFMMIMIVVMIYIIEWCWWLMILIGDQAWSLTGLIDAHDCWGLVEYFDEWWLMAMDHADLLWRFSCWSWKLIMMIMIGDLAYIIVNDFYHAWWLYMMICDKDWFVVFINWLWWRMIMIFDHVDWIITLTGAWWLWMKIDWWWLIEIMIDNNWKWSVVVYDGHYWWSS